MAEPAVKRHPKDIQETVGAADQPSETAPGAALLVRDLGWSRDEAADTRARLRPFEEDWDAEGMDAYDDR